MTTESKTTTRTGVAPLVGAMASGAVAVLVLVVVASVTDGRAGVVGAAAGGVLTLVVFAAGIAMVSSVARLMPSASMLVALMTYTLQLLVLALCVGAIEGAGVTDETLSRGWFAAGVIVVTLLWLTGQLVAATRQRIPLYDTAASTTPTGEMVDHPGGES